MQNDRFRFPLDWICEKNQGRVFWGLFLLTVVVLVGLQAIDAHLKTAAASAGIVSFEMAGTLTRVRQILETWGGRGQVFAGLSLGLDFLFIVSYSSLLALGCQLTVRKFPGPGQVLVWIGGTLAWAQFLAALFDLVENFSLIRLLTGSFQSGLPSLARWCSVLKFSLVGLGILFLLLGFPAAMLAARRKSG